MWVLGVKCGTRIKPKVYPPRQKKKSFREVEIEQRKSPGRSQVCVCVESLQSVEGGRNVSQLCKINVIRNIDET